MLRYRLHCSCFILFHLVHTLHCSCFISVPPVHTSLLMFHCYETVHSPSHSFHLSQFISFIFALFGCIHITWSFNHIIGVTFQPVPSLGISDLRVSLDKFLILDRYSLLEVALRWFYYSCVFILGGEYSGGGLLGSCSCSVEISVLMFCFMVLRGFG